jgi:hypothetical protein
MAPCAQRKQPRGSTWLDQADVADIDRASVRIPRVFTSMQDASHSLSPAGEIGTQEDGRYLFKKSFSLRERLG